MKAEHYADGSCRFIEDVEGVGGAAPSTVEWRFGAPPKGYKGKPAAWYAQCEREALLLSAPPVQAKAI